MSNKIQLTRPIMALAGMALAGFLLQGCEPQPPAGGGADIAGVYNLVSLDGHAVPYAPMHQGQQAPQVSGGSLTINNDGTFSGAINFSDPRITVPAGPEKAPGTPAPGTYTRDGNNLKLKWPGAGYTTVTIDGDKASMNNEGMLFVYQKGKAVTTSANSGKAVLDRFLGNWRYEATHFKSKLTPEERRLTGITSNTRILNGRFVQELGQGSDNGTGLRLFTYDEPKKCYCTWFFSSLPQSTETPATGQWDEAAQTLNWTGPLEDGSSLEAQHRFIKDEAILCSVLVKDHTGGTLFRAEYNLSRVEDAQNPKLPDIETSAAPANQTPEQQVLDAMLGNWNVDVTVREPGKNPEVKHVTEKQAITRILVGHFVQLKVESSLGTSASALILYTYDQRKQCYRFWGFGSDFGGPQVPFDGHWNAAARTMDWTCPAPTEYPITVQHRFISGDNIEYTMLVKDRAGNTVVDDEFKMTRVKEPQE